MPRHCSVLKGTSYACSACGKQIRDGQACVVVHDEKGVSFYHPSCEPQESREQEVTIR
jgi:predicted RNA-binding Zn-ribbon protein involved in translation (DUF1610 family)